MNSAQQLAEPLPQPTPTRRPSRALAFALVGTALCLGAYAACAGLYLRSLADRTTVRGLRVAGHDLGGVPFDTLDERLRAVTDPALDEPLRLTVGEEHVKVSRREAGFIIDLPALAATVRATGKSGNPAGDLLARRRAARGQVDLAIPFSLDREKALGFLTDLKEIVDRAPVDAKLDLERHTVAAEKPGHLLQAYEALVPLEAAARAASATFDLPTVAIAAKIKQADFAAIDISTVLASWETKYNTSQIDSDRTYNLKVGASKLDGHVLKPGELFSFNEVVGDRTEKEGYRVAPVISGGELIDGLAGGMCQIASTLHAASFFAGLDIVSSTPHSRPSAYIPLGLDSTVVWPSTDLKMRNPFDFPVVMHYSVNQGSVKVELLGKKRVYKTVFEREIQEEHSFGSASRRDPAAPSGQKYVVQEGYPSYKAVRRRYLFLAAAALPKYFGGQNDSLQKLIQEKKLTPVRVDKWQIHYPATEQINVYGSGPARMKKKDPPPSHHIPPVPKDQKPYGRILR